MGCDVHQPGDGWICAGFSNYGSSIAMGDQNARTALQSKHAFCGGDIFFEGRLRLLDYADVIAILDKNIVNAFPAGTICPRTMHQDDIFHLGFLSIYSLPAAHNGGTQDCDECGDSIDHDYLLLCFFSSC